MRRIIVLLLSFISFNSKAEWTPCGPTPEIFKSIFSLKKPVPAIEFPSVKLLPLVQVPEYLRKEKQYLTKTYDRLFVGIVGTGYLYELKDSVGQLFAQRVDSSKFHGNSFGAVHFTFKDTIYSLGGYGFWMNNGQLRYFNTSSHDWSLIRLNKDVPFFTALSWIDIKSGKLYCYGSYRINQTIRDPDPSDKVITKDKKQLYVLNINTGFWQHLGELKVLFNRSSDQISNTDAQWYRSLFNSCSLGNFFHRSPEEIYIDNYETNSRLLPTKSFKNEFLKYYSFGEHEIEFFNDSILYYGSISANKYDSIVFNKDDFYASGISVYDAPIQNNILVNNFHIIFVILAFLFFIITYIFINKRNNIKTHSEVKNVPETETKNALINDNEKTVLFDEMEISLIQFILDKSKEEYTVSVNEINKILGLADKNEAVQKKNRNKKINTINAKWMTFSGNGMHLILRKRSEFDKRSIEYYIPVHYFEKLVQIL